MSDKRLKKLNRRQAIGVLGAAGAAMVACNASTPTSPSATTTTTTTTTATPTTSAACVVTPSETAGPFPSITLPVRSDVREDRTGLLLSLAIAVVNASADCAPVTNASVEIWH